MLRFVDMLLPQSGIFQIVEDRFLAGSAFLLVLHPHNCVLHAKIQGKQQYYYSDDPTVSLHSWAVGCL